MTLSFVGLNWWGVGVAEMEAAVDNSSSIGLLDLNRRTDRFLMRSAVQFAVARNRLVRQWGNRYVEAAVVVSPHRISPWMARYLRERSNKLVALAGDVPSGARSIPDQVAAHFDVVGLADLSWSKSLPKGTRIAPAPWGSTVRERDLLAAPLYSPQRLAIVGTAYPERVEIVRQLRESLPIVTVGAWPDIDGVENAPAMARLETLRWLRRHETGVLNILHPQFESGLNPQFFDYVACGVPQLVTSALTRKSYVPTGDGGMEMLPERLDISQLLALNVQIRHDARLNLSFADTIKKVLD